MDNQSVIKTAPRPTCIVCGSSGNYLYKDMSDRLFGVSGLWNIKSCSKSSCKTLWLDPAPLKDELYKAYQNYYTHNSELDHDESFFDKLISGYRSVKYGFQSSYPRRWQKIGGSILGLFAFFKEHMDYPFVYLKDFKRGRLLELGFGSGDTLKNLKKWGWDAEGLDFDPDAVKNASKKGLKVKCGDIFSQNYPDNHFDAIFSSHVLEHVPDPISVLVESFRILSPGGGLVAVTPNRNSILHRLFKKNWMSLDPPRHLFVFTPSALESMARQAGFTNIEIRSSNYSAAGVCFLSYNIFKYGKTRMEKTSSFRYIRQFVRFSLTLILKFFPLSGEELILIAYK